MLPAVRLSAAPAGSALCWDVRAEVEHSVSVLAQDAADLSTHRVASVAGSTAGARLVRRGDGSLALASVAVETPGAVGLSVTAPVLAAALQLARYAAWRAPAPADDDGGSAEDATAVRWLASDVRAVLSLGGHTLAANARGFGCSDSSCT